MAYSDPTPGSRKRKRRRRGDKPPVSGRLQFDDRPQGDGDNDNDLALLSIDLFTQLFPGWSGSSEDSTHPYVALAQKSSARSRPQAASTWTILQCRFDKSVRPSTIRIPRQASCIESLARLLPPASTYTRPPVPNSSTEILLLDAVPLPLDTIFVSLDLDNVRKFQQSQAQYGGGLLHSQNDSAQVKRIRSPALSSVYTDSDNQVLTARGTTHLVRQALSHLSLIHVDDRVPLSFLSHPITHATPTPVVVTACEPVSQGLLTPATRIVITALTPSSLPNHIIPKRIKNRPTIHLPDYSAEVDVDGDDTSNEAFFTAAEDGSRGSTHSVLDQENSSDDTSDLDLSDDPDDIIALTSPPVAASVRSGTMSAMTSATPRLYAPSHIQTPGSVYSNMTATTVRGQRQRSKTMKTQGLLQRIPKELLFPRPSEQEDDESRVYVDTTVLARVGCFSGDWLALQTSVEPPTPLGLASLAMSSFANTEPNEYTEYRPLKVYALPDHMATRTVRYPLHASKLNRRSSISSIASHSAPVPTPIYMSPVLLANLGYPPYVSISRLQTLSAGQSTIPATKITPSSIPPPAAEITLALVNTQTSLLRQLQPSIFATLRGYFACKSRLVKTGDLIAVSFDKELGVATFDQATSEAPDSQDLISARLPVSSADHTGTVVVVWYKVREAISSSPSNVDEDIWSGLMSVDTAITKLSTGAVERIKLPPTADNPWQYYHAVRALPKPLQGYTSTLSELPKLHASELQSRLRNLVAVATRQRADSATMPCLNVLLSSTQRGTGKLHTALRACSDLGVHGFVIDALEIAAEAAGGAADSKSELTLQHRISLAMNCGPRHTCVILRHVENLKSDRMVNTLREALSDARIVIATTTDVDKLSDDLRGLFTHELEVSAPDEAERRVILQSIIASSGIALSSSVELTSVAVKTAALVAGDLVDVVDRAIVARNTRLQELASRGSRMSPYCSTVRDVLISGGEPVSALLSSDFTTAVDCARKNFADSIGAPKIPNVQWSDVGGLANVKDAVMETIQLPLARPELFAEGLKKRSGILFYGPPGTGKTLLAKAIATEFSLNFFSVKGPELLNMYIGESEANVRRVFQRARDARPCVVFFDELDSVAPKRGNQGDSGGVMDRIVSQLLAELDGMSSGSDGSSTGSGGNSGGGSGIFVIGATNRPDLLDQALLRPGRFDKMLYLGISDTHEKQVKILEALTRKFKLDAELSLQRIAATLPFTYTGADLYALCSDAMLKAITRSAAAVDGRVADLNAQRTAQKTDQAGHSQPQQTLTIAQFFDHHATEADMGVVVTEADFAAAQRELVSSVSLEELRHYERVRDEFEGKGRQSDDGADGRDIDGRQAQVNGTGAGKAAVVKAVPSLADVEAWQARRIEEMIGAGFADGSLARNQRSQKLDDEDMVVRTGHLALDEANGRGANGKHASRSKGKGKAVDEGIDGLRDAGDDGLYD